MGQRVLTLADALAMLEGFEPSAIPPPPQVVKLPTYAVDLEDAIFDTIRADYEDFDEWIKKVQSGSGESPILSPPGVRARLSLFGFS